MANCLDGSLVSFTGIQIGERRFVQHAESISEREQAMREGTPAPDPYYAMPGCGLTSKFDKRVESVSGLLSRYHGHIVDNTL